MHNPFKYIYVHPVYVWTLKHMGLSQNECPFLGFGITVLARKRAPHFEVHMLCEAHAHYHSQPPHSLTSPKTGVAGFRASKRMHAERTSAMLDQAGSPWGMFRSEMDRGKPGLLCIVALIIILWNLINVKYCLVGVSTFCPLNEGQWPLELPWGINVAELCSTSSSLMDPWTPLHQVWKGQIEDQWG